MSGQADLFQAAARPVEYTLFVTKEWAPLADPATHHCGGEDTLCLAPAGGCLRPNARGGYDIVMEAVLCMCCGREQLGQLSWGEAFTALHREWSWKPSFWQRFYDLFQNLAKDGWLHWPAAAEQDGDDNDTIVDVVWCDWIDPPPAAQVQAAIEAGLIERCERVTRFGARPAIRTTGKGRAWLLGAPT